MMRAETAATSETRAVCVGKYRLVRRIGAGGMGTVHEAEHLQLGRRYAIKFISSDGPRTARAIQRFQREARLLSRLEHENIVSLLDIGEDEALGPYMVLEYIAGKTLRTELDERGVRPLDRVLDLVAQVARGLAFTHAAGIVHRDLKPENVMLSTHANGRPLVKLLDFGIAKMPRETDDSLTATDTALGTAAYMSPEQAAGNRDIDLRSDVYSLAVIVYEALAGTHPYEGASYNATLFKILNDRHKPLAELRPDLPKRLTDAVEAALAKDPAARPGDVLSWVRTLHDDVGAARPTSDDGSDAQSALATAAEATGQQQLDRAASASSRSRRRQSGILAAALAAAFVCGSLAPSLVSTNLASAVHRKTPPAPAEMPATPRVMPAPEPPPTAPFTTTTATSTVADSSPPPPKARTRTPAPPRTASSSIHNVEPVPTTPPRESTRLTSRGYLPQNPYDAPGNVKSMDVP